MNEEKDFEVTLDGGYIKYNKISQDVMEYLHCTGFRELEPPGENEPKLPLYLGELNNEELGNLYSAFAGWHEYLTTELIKFNVCAPIVGRKRTFLIAKLRKEMRKSKKKFEQDDEIYTDNRYIEVDTEYVQFSTLLDTLKKRLSRIEKDMEVISRHITLLIGSYDEFKRRVRIQNIKSPEDNDNPYE